MAQMYPNHIDPQTKSAAERLLYKLFQQQLDDNYLVFHSVTWLALDRRRRPHDGEADFILAHPEQGILVLEVKGGGIRRNPRTKAWTSFNTGGVTIPIKNPVEQAKESKYVLIDLLRANTSSYLPVGHAVAFPDIAVGEGLLGLDLPRNIILDATDLATLATWVRQAMEYWRGCSPQTGHISGEESIRALRSGLGKQWGFKPVLQSRFHIERQEFIHLTEEQYMILDVLNRQRKALISGFAGSGKTLLAVEKAARLAHQGFRVLLTCYNKTLAHDLRARVDWGTKVDIYHFHDLCIKLAKEAGFTDVTKAEVTPLIF